MWTVKTTLPVMGSNRCTIAGPAPDLHTAFQRYPRRLHSSHQAHPRLQIFVEKHGVGQGPLVSIVSVAIYFRVGESVRYTVFPSNDQEILLVTSISLAIASCWSFFAPCSTLRLSFWFQACLRISLRKQSADQLGPRPSFKRVVPLQFTSSFTHFR
jgi:hypothetical protein